jgi:hypothetical protein
MDTPLVPRDETAREIDPDGILDAPDSPVSHTNSQQNASDFANTGSDMSDDDKSDSENEDMRNAATLPSSTRDEDGSGMDTDEAGRIRPEDSSVVSGISGNVTSGTGTGSGSGISGNVTSGTGSGSGFVSQLLIQTLSSGAVFRISQMVLPIGRKILQSEQQAALVGSIKAATAAQCASENNGNSAAQIPNEKTSSGSSPEKSRSVKVN